MKTDVLKEIVAKKKERIAQAKFALPEEELKARIAGLAPAVPFLSAIARPKTISLIAEIKKASPSKGVIRGDDFNPAEIAKTYCEAGVQAISVLTEEDFFAGQIGFLQAVRSAAAIPVLRKDFILEAYQVFESRYFGADAILLIAELLTKDEITQFIQLADSLGLGVLVETHSEKELKKVLSLKVPVSARPDAPQVKPSVPKKGAKTQSVNFAIGINNRDLHTLEVDFKITERLFTMVPKDRIVVIESGIQSSQDVLFLRILGASAVLVGTAFMAAGDIRRKVEELMGW